MWTFPKHEKQKDLEILQPNIFILQLKKLRHREKDTVQSHRILNNLAKTNYSSVANLYTIVVTSTFDSDSSVFNHGKCVDLSEPIFKI